MKTRLASLERQLASPSRCAWATMLLLLALTGCSGEASANIPASSDGTPAAPPSAPVAPGSGVPTTRTTARCRLEPEGGVVVVTDRRAPQVLVGDTHALIMHEARRSPGPCHGSPSATVVPVPVSASFRAEPAPPPCAVSPDNSTNRMERNGRLERVAGVPTFLGCRCEPDLIAGCTCSATVPPGAFGGHWFGMNSSHTSTGGLGIDLAVDGDWAYVVVDMDDTGNGRQGIFGLRVQLSAPPEGRPHWRRVGAEPASAARHGLRLEIVENRPDRTVVLYGPASSSRATRVVMGPDGLRQGGAESVAWPTPAVPRVSVMSARDGRRAPPYVRLVVDGQARAITGVDERAGAFSPALVEVGGVPLLFWSEGLGERTRVYGAPLDIDRAALGQRFVVTRGDVESGDVHADSFGAHAVVTWSQREGAGHAVRAANVLCGP